MSPRHSQHPGSNEPPHPWGRAAIWLSFLGPFFFISYGFSTWLSSQNPTITSIVFDWEQHIPFIPWSIIPYWIIDVLYVVSLFICTTQKEVDVHAKRLLTAQIVAVICFVFFPLSFSFVRPETSGITGWLFSVLSSFDQPYNQAPSLHISLLIILWVHYLRHLPGKWVWPFHILCAIIGVSVLTTYQHHFIDIPTGALLGWLCVWLWPMKAKSMFQSGQLGKDSHRWKMTTYYLAGSIMIMSVAIGLSGIAYCLVWPAVSLLLVSFNYAYLGSAGFQKEADGRMGIAARWLYFPYLLGAYANSRIWTRNEPKAVKICDRIYLGRLPAQRDIKASGYEAVVDMTAEFNKTDSTVAWHSIPCLDLLVPSKENLLAAARIISSIEKKKILVACALGYSRSALAVIAWLLVTRRVNSVDNAIAMVKQQRPAIVISDEARLVLSALIEAEKPGSSKTPGTEEFYFSQ